MTFLFFFFSLSPLPIPLSPYTIRYILQYDFRTDVLPALKIKLEGEQGDNGVREKITPLCLLLDDPEDPRLPPAEEEEEEEKSSAAEASGAPEGRRSRRKKFDLITSHLVLHHIADVRGVLATMLGCLRPGGEVALTDYADDGPGARRFHPEARMGGVEHPRGIDPAWLAGLLREVGFAVGGDSDDDDDDGVLGVDGAAWTMDKEVERWPGEWGGLDGGPMVGRPAEGAEVVGFPFLLARARRRA